MADNMNPCRAFRYIAHLTQDEQILSLCSVGESLAKIMGAKIESLTEEVTRLQTQVDEYSKKGKKK